MSVDLIRLNGVECRCRVGVPDAERRRPQKVLLDLCLELDVSRAAAKDDFRLAVDYWAVEKQARAVAEAKERRLVETLASDVAEELLKRQPLVSAVAVRAHKTPAVMPKTREIVVELRRTR